MNDVDRWLEYAADDIRMAELALWLRHPATHEQLAGYQDQVRALDAFYIPTRYPDAMPGMLAEGEPQRRDAESALQNAESILAAIRAALDDRS